MQSHEKLEKSIFDKIFHVLLILVSIFLFAACSSAPHEEEEPIDISQGRVYTGTSTRVRYGGCKETGLSATLTIKPNNTFELVVVGPELDFECKQTGETISSSMRGAVDSMVNRLVFKNCNSEDTTGNIIHFEETSVVGTVYCYAKNGESLRVTFDVRCETCGPKK